MWILSAVFAVASSIAGYLYYLTPAVVQTIQTIMPPPKAYVICRDSILDVLTPGKKPVLNFVVENGPVATTATFKDVSYSFTRLMPEKYLTYSPNAPTPNKFSLAPNQTVTARWIFNRLFTQEEIDELNAEQPTAELYLFARGEYTDDTGSHPVPYCRKYDKDAGGRLVFCDDGISFK